MNRWVLLSATSMLLACSSFRGLPQDAASDADGDATSVAQCSLSERGAFRGVIADTRSFPLVDLATRAPFEFHGKSATVDREGRVLLAGGIRGCLTPGRFAAAVLRLTTNYELDPTFNGSGRVCVAAPMAGGVTDAMAFAVAEDASGRVVIAGTSNGAQGQNRGLLARWSGTGVIDRSFGTDGVVDYRPGLTASAPGGSVVFHSIVLDGVRIVAAGSSSQPYSRGDAALVTRFTDDGAVDSDFHRGAIYADSSLSGFYGLVAQDGGYLLAGSTIDPTRVRVLRLTESGELDPNFGAAGVAEHPRSASVFARSIGVDGAGRIYVGGGRTAVYGDTSMSVVVRYAPDGTPDLAYGAGGAAVLSDVVWWLAYEFDKGMIVRCDGSVFVGGSRGMRGAIGALDPSGALADGFGVEGVAPIPSPREDLYCGSGLLLRGRAAGSIATMVGCSSNQNQMYVELRP